MLTDNPGGGDTSSPQNNTISTLAVGPSGVGGGGDIPPAPGPAPGDPNAAGQPPAQLSMLYTWALESGVFVLLLLLHFFYDHRLGKLLKQFEILVHSFLLFKKFGGLQAQW